MGSQRVGLSDFQSPYYQILDSGVRWQWLMPTWGGLACCFLGFPCGSKNPPAMQETPVLFLNWEDPLEKEKATHSSILAWEVHGVVKSQTRLNYFHFTSCLRKWGSHPPVKEKHGHTSAQRSTSLLLPRGLCHTWCNGIGFKLIFRNVWIRKNLTSHSTGEQWSLS